MDHNSWSPVGKNAIMFYLIFLPRIGDSVLWLDTSLETDPILERMLCTFTFVNSASPDMSYILLLFGLGLGGGFKSCFHHMLGHWSNLTNIYQMDSNHQLVAYIYMYIYKYICVNIHHIFLYTFGQILRTPHLRHPPFFAFQQTKIASRFTSSSSQGDGGCNERHCRVGSKAGHDFESQGRLANNKKNIMKIGGNMHPPNHPF